MAKRKSISASTRWQVFARDGFCCRYCGSQAGEEGVELAVDHMVSVADGGDNAMDNLLTACKRCNGGKSAKSIRELPAPAEVVDRLNNKAARMSEQVQAIQACIEQRKALAVEVLQMKSAAYDWVFERMHRSETQAWINLIYEFGAPVVFIWMNAAAAKEVEPSSCIKYVCGIARNCREEG